MEVRSTDRRRTVVGSPQEEHARFERATADLDPPFAVLDIDALWTNAGDLVRRAAGKQIRLASKSVRCRSLQEPSTERGRL
jgi:D-serine deaminase-like pyridoxal phosphate-dependent protein